MKVVTVNVPESYVELMKKLVGKDGLFPSRSELVRVAVRSFLLKELRLSKNFKKFEPDVEIVNEENVIFLPIETKNENGETIRSFEKIRVLRKLE